jgi:hypothetical protein
VRRLAQQRHRLQRRLRLGGGWVAVGRRLGWRAGRCCGCGRRACEGRPLRLRTTRCATGPPRPPPLDSSHTSPHNAHATAHTRAYDHPHNAHGVAATRLQPQPRLRQLPPPAGMHTATCATHSCCCCCSWRGAGSAPAAQARGAGHGRGGSAGRVYGQFHTRHAARRSGVQGLRCWHKMTRWLWRHCAGDTVAVPTQVRVPLLLPTADSHAKHSPNSHPHKHTNTQTHTHTNTQTQTHTHAKHS